jgi:hypothetical protein
MKPYYAANNVHCIFLFREGAETARLLRYNGVSRERQMSESPNLESPDLEPPSLEPPGLEPPSLIMVQFLTWVADRPRNYAETMGAWRTSCPRLSVWEDAVIDGLVRVDNYANRAVGLTPRGRAVLKRAVLERAASEKAKIPAL